jgi:hypothetical protein
MRHNNDALMAVSREPKPTRFQKTLAMNDWYLGADDWDYPLGGIQMLGKSDDEEIHAQAPRWAGKISPDLPFEVLAHHAVVDTSFFPSIGAVNPSLTAIANALRVGDHITERLR